MTTGKLKNIPITHLVCQDIDGEYCCGIVEYDWAMGDQAYEQEYKKLGAHVFLHEFDGKDLPMDEDDNDSD